MKTWIHIADEAEESEIKKCVMSYNSDVSAPVFSAIGFGIVSIWCLLGANERVCERDSVRLVFFNNFHILCNDVR